METSINSTDQTILALLQADDERAMERIFDEYYSYLVTTAYHVLMDQHQAKDLVQDVLFHFWSKKDTLTIENGLKSYLRRSVVNRSIDQIRRKKRFGVAEEITDYNQASTDVSTQEMMENSPVGSSQSKGTVERRIQSIEGQVRTLRSAFEARANSMMPTSSCLYAWMVIHAGNILNLFDVGKDGKVPCQRLRGARCTVKGLSLVSGCCISH